jgi:ABC-type transport system substrate-binding protein
MLWMTMREGTPLADPVVRRALAIGIDRTAIAEQALSGMASPAHSVFNQRMPGHDETEFFAYDPEQARQLLADAGYAEGDVAFELLGYNEGISPDLMTIAAAQWAEIGVNVTVTILERALLYERWRNREFDMIEQPIARDMPEQIVFPYFTEGGHPYPNSSLYTGIEELASQLRSEADLDERLRLYGEIQAKLVEDVAVIPTVNPRLVLGMRPGIEPFPLSIWYYPLWQLTVSE